jgi:hypothetical protein
MVLFADTPVQAATRYRVEKGETTEEERQMRQWELIGITDTVDWTPPRRDPAPADDEEHFPAVLWTTDGSLRLRGVSWVASQHLGVHPRFLDGRELLEAFGMEGESLPILEAHAAALTGETVTFSLPGIEGRMWCRVAPTHDAGEHIVGTFCIATEPASDGADREAAQDTTLTLV